ncbi:MAG: hypothetical protein AAGC88_00885 [Bacteroidota bacterium]
MSWKKIETITDLILSNQTKEKAEQWTIWVAIGSFIIHLVVIGLVNLHLLKIPFESELLTNPVSAIYTPFSFMLLFEVYLLVYHIPLSTSDYIAKQYEIITLIVIRRIFKDLSNLDLSIDWFQDKNDLLFTYDILTALVLFLLIYVFHRLIQKETPQKIVDQLPIKVQLFIKRKQLMAALLVPAVLMIAMYSFTVWLIDTSEWIRSGNNATSSFIDINNIFFDEFFTLLILTDVLLLLFSFFHTTRFDIFIRNSGFIISTVLIRISFSVDGLVNNILIVVAVIFGVLILLINRQYQKLDQKRLKV